MSIISNATTKAHKELTRKFIEAAGGDPDFTDASLVFDAKAKTVTINYPDKDIEGMTLPYADATAFIDRGFTAERRQETPDRRAEVADVVEPERPVRAQPKPSAKGKKGEPKPKAEPKAKAEPRKDKPEPKVETGEKPRDDVAIEKIHADLGAAVQALAQDVEKERTGELDKNAARYAKGMHLDKLETLGERLKNAGDPDFKRRGAVLTYARDALRNALARPGVVDPRDRLSPQEVTYTRKVYQTYLKYQDGLAGTFEYIETIDPQTGDPLVADSGNPYVFPVTSIALQKLYMLAPFYLDQFRDKILSFAHRNTEKVVAASAKLMDATKGNIAEVIDAVNAAQAASAGEDDYSAEDAALDHVAVERGETPPSSVKSIKVDAGWYQGDWTDIKRVATAIAVRFGLPCDDKGEMGNTFLLERLLSVFVPREYGASNIVQILVDTETIDKKQAETFLREYANVEGPTLVGDADETEGEEDA